MNSIERLEAIENIKQVKARYFRAIDLKDRQLLSGVFTPDVACDFRGAATDPATGLNAAPGASGVVLQGAQNAVDAILNDLDQLQCSVHHGTMPEIEITGPTTAAGIWAMTDLLRFPQGSSISGLVAWGHYHETYECIDGAWKIKTLKLTRLRVDVFRENTCERVSRTDKAINKKSS